MKYSRNQLEHLAKMEADKLRDEILSGTMEPIDLSFAIEYLCFYQDWEFCYDAIQLCYKHPHISVREGALIALSNQDPGTPEAWFMIWKMARYDDSATLRRMARVTYMDEKNEDPQTDGQWLVSQYLPEQTAEYNHSFAKHIDHKITLAVDAATKEAKAEAEKARSEARDEITRLTTEINMLREINDNLRRGLGYNP